MKVRLYGFTLKAGHAKISLGDLYAHLKALSGAANTTRLIERRIYFDETIDSTFARGLIVTVKDQKRFCKLIEDQGRLVINVENLHGDDKLMEFNFFVINKNNGIGLYQQYHHSCSLGVFGGYLRDCYRNLSEVSAAQEIDFLKRSGTHTNYKEQKIRASMRRALSVATLIHAGSLSSILREFKKINSFEYEFAQLSAIRHVAQPLQPYVKRRKESVIFGPFHPIAHIADAIQDAVNSIAPKKGRVHVETLEGDPLSVQLANIPEHFGEYEYDDVAARLDNLDTAQFAQHQTYAELQGICNSTAYKHIFHARIQP